MTMRYMKRRNSTLTIADRAEAHSDGGTWLHSQISREYQKVFGRNITTLHINFYTLFILVDLSGLTL